MNIKFHWLKKSLGKDWPIIPAICYCRSSIDDEYHGIAIALYFWKWTIFAIHFMWVTPSLLQGDSE